MADNPTIPGVDPLSMITSGISALTGLAQLPMQWDAYQQQKRVSDFNMQNVAQQTNMQLEAQKAAQLHQLQVQKAFQAMQAKSQGANWNTPVTPTPVTPQ